MEIQKSLKIKEEQNDIQRTSSTDSVSERPKRLSFFKKTADGESVAIQPVMKRILNQ